MCGVTKQSYIAFVNLVDASEALDDLKLRMIQEHPEAFKIEEK